MSGISLRQWIHAVIMRLSSAAGNDHTARRRNRLRMTQTERLEVRSVLSVVIVSNSNGHVACDPPLGGIEPYCTHPAPQEISIADAVLAEPVDGQQMMSFTLTRSGNYLPPLEVTYQTRNGTALAGEDYVAALPGSSVLFYAGQITTSISVSIIGDDVVEAGESFDIMLTGIVERHISMPQSRLFATDIHPTVRLQAISTPTESWIWWSDTADPMLSPCCWPASTRNPTSMSLLLRHISPTGRISPSGGVHTEWLSVISTTTAGRISRWGMLKAAISQCSSMQPIRNQ